MLLPILLIPLEPVSTLLLPDDIAEGRGYPGPGVLRGRGPAPPPLMEASRLDVRPGLSSNSDDPDWRVKNLTKVICYYTVRSVD